MEGESCDLVRKKVQPLAAPNKYRLYNPQELGTLASYPHLEPGGSEQPIVNPSSAEDITEHLETLCSDIQACDIDESTTCDKRMAALDLELIPGPLHVMDDNQLVTAVCSNAYVVYQDHQREMVSLNLKTQRRVTLERSDEWVYTNGVPLQYTGVIDSTPVYAIVGPDGTYNQWDLVTGALQVEHIFWYNEKERVVANSLLIRSNGDVVVSHEPEIATQKMTVFHLRSTDGTTRQVYTRFTKVTSMCETDDGVIWASSVHGPIFVSPDEEYPIVRPYNDIVNSASHQIERVGFKTLQDLYLEIITKNNEPYDTLWFTDQVYHLYQANRLYHRLLVEPSPSHFVTTNGTVVVCITSKGVLYIHPVHGLVEVPLSNGFVSLLVSETDFVVMKTSEKVLRIRVTEKGAVCSDEVVPVLRAPTDTPLPVEAFPTSGVMSMIGDELYITVFQNAYTSLKLA